ncbi:MAG: NUDIX hydrolase [Desulfomonilaceae bacterium]|nr:NUDIX hydrolase [Desulfomonilaceae bacterium]
MSAHDASDSEPRNLRWELIDTREDRSYSLFSVSINRNRSPRTGQVHEFQVLNSPDWVAVVAVTPDNNLVMVRQYRHGTGELSLEPPGGLVKEGRTAEQSGREELEEETGYQADSLELLGWMHPMPALFTNRFYVFLARNAVPTGKLDPDETEEVETILVPLEEIREYIKTGRIRCAVMIAALHLFLEHVSVPD